MGVSGVVCGVGEVGTVAKVTDQYGKDTSHENTDTVSPKPAVLPKDLTDLPARVIMLENKVIADHDTLTQLRRDVSRMRDHITSLEQHIYNLRSALR